MDMLFLLIVWLVLCILVSVYASSKGFDSADSAGYFILALLLSPLVGFIAVAISKPSEKDLVQAGRVKKCPFCAELVQPEAIICRYCGREMPARVAAPVPASSYPCAATPGKKTSIAVPAVVVGFIVVGAALLVLLTLTAPSREKANEDSAVARLKTLNTALGAYAATYADGRKVYMYPDSLRKLRTAAGSPSAAAGGLLDDLIASDSFERSGYVFSFIPKRTRSGWAASYEIRATPTSPSARKRRFFINQEGTLTFTLDGSPPTSKSPQL